MLLCLALCAVSLTLECSNELEGQNQGGSSRGKRPPGAKQGLGAWGAPPEAVPVEAGKPWRTDMTSYVFGNAHIEALREVEIVARVDGMLEYLAVEEGDKVKQGQVLATLDKSELRLNLKEANARLENNRNVYERTLKMLEQDLTSQEALEKAKYDYETAKAQKERAELNLHYATITAPFSGVITRRAVEQGDMIRSGTVLFQLADVEKLRLRVYVPEKEMGRISVGNPVRIQTEMYPGRYFSGVVEMIAPVVDPLTGTLKVTVRVTDEQGILRPGMFCSVYILIDTRRDVLVISRKALIPDTEVPEVFVVDDSGLVHRRQLEIGIQQGDTLEVVKGLSEDELVVLVGQESLHEGAPVQVMNLENVSESALTPTRPSSGKPNAHSRNKPPDR